MFISLSGFVLLVVMALCGITLWLDSPRLTKLINREASANLNADVKVWNARFSLWSTFPRFYIEMDSIDVVSRSLDGLDKAVLDSLPRNCRHLMSLSGFKGSIDLVSLLRGEIKLGDVVARDFDLNLVAATPEVANYNIFPSSASIGEIPHFSAQKIELVNPRSLRFFSLVTASDINVGLKRISIVRTRKRGDDYLLSLGGLVNARVNNIGLLNGFPFGMEGRVKFDFNPFSVKLSDYIVSFGDTKGKVNLDFEVGKEMKINRFTYQLQEFNFNDVVSYLPEGLIPELKSVRADIPLTVSARLTTPYKFSSAELPSVEADFRVENGRVSYKFDNTNVYSLHNVELNGKFCFDGKNRDGSYLTVPAFNVKGEGVDLRMGFTVNDIFSTPVVRFRIEGGADAGVAGKLIKELNNYGLSGCLTAELDGNLSADDLQYGRMENVVMRGDVSVKDFKFVFPPSNMHGFVKYADFKFGGEAKNISGTSIDKGLFDFVSVADSVWLSSGNMSANINGVKLSSSTGRASKVYLASSRVRLPLNLDLATATVHLVDNQKSTNVRLHGLEAHGSMNMNQGSRELDNIALKIDGKEVKGMLDGSTLDFDNITLLAKANRILGSESFGGFDVPPSWVADKKYDESIPHTPRFLKADFTADIKSKLSSWDGGMELKVDSGRLLTPAFPVMNKFRNLHLYASLDSVVLHRLNLQSQSSGICLAGRVDNLRQFLFSTGISPLKVRFDADLDTVQINQLAGAYERGQLVLGHPVVYDRKNSNALVGSDTVAFLIPRNLIADINMSAKMTRYMNLKLENLDADIHIADGEVCAPKIAISSDFGNLLLGFSLNTGNIQDFGLKLKGGVTDVNLVNFFRNFHTLLLMMPQMKNLTGVLSADVDASMKYFPNMYVNIPSLYAGLGFHGNGLTVHQDPFIRKITRMLLIPNSGDIHIKNIDAKGVVVDNLVQLYPFDLEFENYSLRMQGTNNFSGDMYYHIGVNHSPVPFPFGINIQGNFSDPQVRFGGAKYKVNRGAQVSRSIMEHHEVNMVQMLRKYLKEFLHKAAESDTTPESEYIFKPKQSKP